MNGSVLVDKIAPGNLAPNFTFDKERMEMMIGCFRKKAGYGVFSLRVKLNAVRPTVILKTGRSITRQFKILTSRAIHNCGGAAPSY